MEPAGGREEFFFLLGRSRGGGGGGNDGWGVFGYPLSNRAYFQNDFPLTWVWARQGRLESLAGWFWSKATCSAMESDVPFRAGVTNPGSAVPARFQPGSKTWNHRFFEEKGRFISIYLFKFQ